MTSCALLRRPVRQHWASEIAAVRSVGQARSGSLTKRQKSYDKASLRKPVASGRAIAIAFCNTKRWASGHKAGSCVNLRFRDIPLIKSELLKIPFSRSYDSTSDCRMAELFPGCRQYFRNPCGQLRKEKTPTLAQVMAATREACVVPRRVTVIFEILQPRARRSHGRSTTQPRIALPTHPPTAAWSNARSHVSVHRAKFVLHVPVQAEGEVTAGRAVHYATSLENAPATSWRTVCIPIRTLRDHRLHSLLSSDPWLPPAARIRRQRVRSTNR